MSKKNEGRYNDYSVIVRSIFVFVALYRDCPWDEFNYLKLKGGQEYFKLFKLSVNNYV